MNSARKYSIANCILEESTNVDYMFREYKSRIANKENTKERCKTECVKGVDKFKRNLIPLLIRNI